MIFFGCFQFSAAIQKQNGSFSNQKEPWEFEQDKYRWWHLIANFFAKLKQYRGIATRYDKRACAFLGAIHWVAAVIWLN